MLALHNGTTIHKTFQRGQMVTLPGGDAAYAQSGDTWGEWRCDEVQPADDIPAGKRSTGNAVQTVNGAPKWVHTLEDIPLAEFHAKISAERDRRIELGLTVNIGGTDRTFQFDAKSRENINGGATLAGFAMGAGAGAGNYLWHGGAQPFSWILADNSVIQLDAPTMFMVGQAAANRVSRFTFAARAIKDMDPLPADVTDDALWPV
jgi:hypothetical protein